MNARQRIVKIADRCDLRIIFASCALFDKVVIENPGEGTSGTTVQEETARRDENESEGRANYKYKRDRVAFMFYDFETRQGETCEGTKNVQIHVPIFCVA